MSKDPSIPRRTGIMSGMTTCSLPSSWNSNAFKEYYAIATGAAPPKPKASVWKTRSSSDITITPPTVVAGPRLTTSAKGKQAAKASKAKSLYALSEVAMIEAQPLKLVTKRSLQQTYISQASGFGADEGTDSISGVFDVPTDESEEELFWNSTDDEGDDDEGKDGDGDEEDDEYDEETMDNESFNPISKTPENSDDEGNGKEDLGLNVGREEGHDEEEEEDELYRDININQGRGIQATLEVEDSHVTLTPRMNEAVKVAVQIQSDCLHDEAQRENDEFLKIVDENMQKIINEQVKEQIKTLASEFAFAEEPMQAPFQMEEPSHPEFDTGAKDQPIVQSSQHPKWFSQQQKPPSLDRDWNKTVPATHESIQPWISELMKLSDSLSYFNKLMDTPLDFSSFLINQLKMDTLTPEFLIGPTYELMKGSCKSLVELKYHLEEVFKATIDQLDWVNPEGQQYPHNLLKPLPLIPNNRGHRVIPFEHFINNNLEYLREGASSRKYTTSITKTKAADYGHIKWIEDLVPRTMWIEEAISYDKHALWGRRIIAVTKLKIVEWHNYMHLDWITVRRDDDKLYKFKKGDFKRLRIQDIEDMLLLLVQGKLTNLTVKERFAFNVSIRMFTRSIVIQRRFIYQNKDKKNRSMRIDELHKFSDGTLIDVRTALDDRLKGIRMQYLPQSIWRKSEKDRAAAMIQSIDKRLKTRRIMRSFGGRLRVKDLQLGVESYQKKLNLTKLDTYRHDLKRKEAYIAYSNPRGFIYQNKDKKNKLMR
nr:hypothetical protein [Tanacetum cinerariifolium]